MFEIDKSTWDGKFKLDVTGGGTVVFSSHVMEVVERLCTHVAILADGTIKRVGTLAEVRGDRALEEVKRVLEKRHPLPDDLKDPPPYRFLEGEGA